MNELFGFTRTAAKSRYALLTPDSFVLSHLPGWKNAAVIVNISPEMGAQFSQYQVTLGPNSRGDGNTHSFEHFIYVIAGKCSGRIGGKKMNLLAGSYLFIPPATDFHFSKAATGTQLLIFQKKYEPLAGAKKPELIAGHKKNVSGRPFLGNKDARLQVLLPDEPAFDLAVNIFTYQPGATLPFVETHIMEHGLLMLAGQGIYRLDHDWHPVKAGDVIWMAPYCPQWFVAMGKSPASYIYYKDVNRAPHHGRDAS
ncbi:MAG TPA: (S)-ureidoglycine aminohydrolase [Pseudomonadales bacterium]|nr:(S)-ureidoglycine aminohydrolase [Pseudomonadales bacterium]